MQNPAIFENYNSREAILTVNSALIEQLRSRLKNRRFKVQAGDTIRIAYMRTLITALTAHNQVLRDVELGQLRQEIEELKEVMKTRSRD